MDYGRRKGGLKSAQNDILAAHEWPEHDLLLARGLAPRPHPPYKIHGGFGIYLVLYQFGILESKH